ncbi:hypothetical protein M378DRAFT_626353 [Amanita muscaria Koide BX008]|uniref:F-box domain-containing protein n=1 Tax=Amanita muscaria (strain Koide BX008) TaxID=946122 RepID=A0A0C2XLX6_AMAMK|nr:hypothetical protein M378DRAFT_626353 [Amanita muscaria Koide BX008]
MLFLILELPDEIVDRIVEHLPVCDIPSLALTCHRLHNISISHYYSLVSISCLAGVGPSETYNQQKSITVMEALKLDQRKRSGVERLELHHLYSSVSPHEEQASIYVKPLPVHISHNHCQGRLRPRYNQLVHDLLGLDFPKLDTLVFDLQGLKSHSDFLHFLSFLQRHTQIKRLEIEYDRWMWAERFIFPENLPIFTLAHLEELTIPSHLLPCFIRYLSDGARDRDFDTCTLRKVHLWWMTLTSDVSSIQDTLTTLAGVSGNALVSLQITVPDNSTVNVIETIANDFPRLTNLEFCTAGTGRRTMLVRNSNIVV